MSEFVWELPPFESTTPPSSVQDTGEAIDHTVGAIKRLVQQFKGKPNIEAFIQCFTAPMQRLEQAFVDIIVKHHLDNAEGDQLRHLAKIVGQEVFDGISDTDLRRYVRARIYTNKSSGVGKQIIHIGRLVLDDDAVTLKVTRVASPGVTKVTLADSVVSYSVAKILAYDFYGRAVGVGVRIVLEWCPRARSSMFQYKPFTGTAAGKGYASFSDPTVGGHLAAAADNSGEDQ